MWVKVWQSGSKWRRMNPGAVILKGKVELMFLGEFYHNLDEKGRLTVPAKYRELLVVDGAYITHGFDPNLMVLPMPFFEMIAHTIRKLSLTDPEARLLRRIFFSGASLLEVDKAGRILIPQNLRKFAGLENEVVITGVGDHFEIWSADQWRVQDEEIQKAQGDAQRFIAMGLSSEDI